MVIYSTQLNATLCLKVEGVFGSIRKWLNVVTDRSIGIHSYVEEVYR